MKGLIVFWKKTDKERLIGLLEWFLSHDWQFTKIDYRKLKQLNTFLLRFDIEPVWVNFSIYDWFYLKSAERERLFEVYKKLKDEQ